MRKIGIYEQWKAVKQKIVSEVARVKQLYKKDCDEMKAHGSKPRTTDPKYFVVGFKVKLSLHFFSTIHFESFADSKYLLNVLYYTHHIKLNYIQLYYTIQRAAFNKKGVQVFTMWDWLRLFVGTNHDWIGCRIACIHHDYTDNAKKALVELGIIPNVSVLDGAKAAKHYVCRILCHKHAGKTLSTVVCPTESNVAQHILRKKYAKAVIQLF